MSQGVECYSCLPKTAWPPTFDVLPQDHVAWSDAVLPEATYLERYDDLWACGHKTPYLAKSDRSHVVL